MNNDTERLEAELNILAQIETAEEELVNAKKNNDMNERRRLKDVLYYLHARRRNIQGYT